jgi:hypothetical protein
MMIFAMVCVSLLLICMGGGFTGSLRGAIEFYLIVSLSLGAIGIPIIFLDNRDDLDYCEVRINRIHNQIETTRRILEAVERIK